MRFVYILVNDKIQIEIQKNRDKLSPFIRNKKIISNLYADLKIENDKRIFQYIKLLNQTQPPFEIGKDFLSSELIKIIEDSNFIFSKVNIKSSLKKLTNFSSLNTLVYKKDYEIISPKKLKIINFKFYKDKVSVLFYFEFDEIEKDVSINYDFQIPLVKSKEIAIISNVEKTKLLNLYKSIVNQDIMHSKYITIDKLNQLNENELINIQYKSESKKQKSVDFVSNTLFKIVYPIKNWIFTIVCLRIIYRIRII